MRKHKIMFLFGAGASYGNSAISSNNPPLGKQLYPKLVENNFFWNHYSRSHFNDDIRSEFGSNFESAFTKIADLLPASIVLQLQIGMMEYLNQFDPHPSLEENNYYKLISALREHNLLCHSSFSSLNYDCIFEKILNICDVKYCDYLGNSDENYKADVKIYKLHGSSNYTIRRSNFDAQWVSFSPEVKLDLPIEALRYSTPITLDNLNHRSSLWPIMSLYTKGKEHHHCQTSIARIRKKWAYETHKSTHIVLIGIRPILDDVHIWNPIRQSKAKIIFFGNPESLDGFQRRKNLSVVDQYFNDSCTNFMSYLDI